ncbi:hypothetical protein D3C72_1612570 [compost metagenome]
MFSFQAFQLSCSGSLRAERSRSSSSPWSGRDSRNSGSRSQSFWKGWLKNCRRRSRSKIATGVSRCSSVSAWLFSVRASSSRSASSPLTSTAMPHEPDGSRMSTTSKKVRLPRTAVETTSWKGDSGVALALIFSRLMLVRISRDSRTAWSGEPASTASL